MNKQKFGVRLWLWIALGAAVVIAIGFLVVWKLSGNNTSTSTKTSPTPTKSAVTSASPGATNSASASKTATPSEGTNNQNNQQPSGSKFDDQIGGIGCDTINASFYYPESLRVYQGNVYNQNPNAPLWLSDPSTSSEFNPAGTPTGISAETNYYSIDQKKTICELVDSSAEFNAIIDSINTNPFPDIWENYQVNEAPTRKIINGNIALTWYISYSVKNGSTPSHPNPVNTNTIIKHTIIINKQNNKIVDLSIIKYIGAPAIPNFDSNYLSAYDNIVDTFQFK